MSNILYSNRNHAKADSQISEHGVLLGRYASIRAAFAAAKPTTEYDYTLNLFPQAKEIYKQVEGELKNCFKERYTPTLELDMTEKQIKEAQEYPSISPIIFRYRFIHQGKHYFTLRYTSVGKDKYYSVVIKKKQYPVKLDETEIRNLLSDINRK